MKKTITTIKALIIVVMSAVIMLNSINIAHAPTLNEDYLIAPIAEATTTEETNEFVERAMQVSEGYDFVEYISTTESEVIYIVEDNDGVQYKIAYSENNGNPVSTIVVYSVPQN